MALRFAKLSLLLVLVEEEENSTQEEEERETRNGTQFALVVSSSSRATFSPR